MQNRRRVCGVRIDIDNDCDAVLTLTKAAASWEVARQTRDVVDLKFMV